eukprot:scaffold87370_cov37-Cyclotella_meneghiniana.AAC.1
MNKPVPSSEDSRLDEWGNYIQRREDVLSINDDGVMEAIQNNNPAITAVRVDVGYDDDEATEISDWGAVGRYLGSSRHVKHLNLEFWGIIDSLDLKSFCDGLAINTSVESLMIKLSFDDDYNDRVDSFPAVLFSGLLPFFKNNSNLIAVDFLLHYSIFLTDGVNEVISASSSLKAIKIKGREHCLENIVTAISKNEGVRHITID